MYKAFCYVPEKVNDSEKKSDYSILQCFLALLQNCWRNRDEVACLLEQKSKKPRNE